MIISFILPSIEVMGGVRTVFELSNQLILRKHHVNIVYSAITPWDEINNFKTPKGLARGFYKYFRSIFKYRGGDWFPRLHAQVIRIPKIRSHYFPDGDILLATAWPTAHEVFNASNNKGRKFYFIQGYEIWSGPPNQVKATYRLPMKRITISTFLKEILKKECGVEACGPVINGVNFEQFYRIRSKFNSSNRIGMLYNPHPLKGVDDGIQAFEKTRKEHPDISLVMLGVGRKPSRLPKYIEYHRNVKQDELKDIYSSCNIWLVPSRLEGCCLIPMEAMACRCAVVTTRIGGIDDYAIPGKTALVSEPGDVDGLSENLCKLLENNKLLLEVADRGYRHIQNYSWAKTTDSFENCLT